MVWNEVYPESGERDMVEKRSYKEVLASLETHIIYINNHCKNVDSHLAKLNDTVADSKLEIARLKVNKLSTTSLYKIGGGLLTIIGGAVTLVLKLTGVF